LDHSSSSAICSNGITFNLQSAQNGKRCLDTLCLHLGLGLESDGTQWAYGLDSIPSSMALEELANTFKGMDVGRVKVSR
jgi:hypothetical protein